MENTNDENNQETNQKAIQEFITEYELLVEKHNVKEYISIITIGDTQFTLYTPKDIMKITKILKSAHKTFYSEVMRTIGESN